MTGGAAEAPRSKQRRSSFARFDSDARRLDFFATRAPTRFVAQ